MSGFLPLLAVLAGCTPADPVGFDVALVSIDGAGWPLLSEEWAHLGTLPSLATDPVPAHIHGAPETRASHARMLTGYSPEVTGVVNGDHWQVIPEGLTLHERLSAAFGGDVAVLWIASKPAMLGFEEGEAFQHAGEAADVAFDDDVPTVVLRDEALAAVDAVGRRPFFGFFHFGAVDHEGHAHGERSEEQREALARVDGALGSLLAAFEARGREARIYVTSDHGFDEGTDRHVEDSEDVFLVTNDHDVAEDDVDGDRIAWTVLDRYGIEVEDPPHDALPL